MPEKATCSSYSQVLFRSELVTIGHFHLPCDSPDFQTAGAIARPTLVFPRTQMWIQKQDQRRYLSHPNVLNVYDGNQDYVRYQPAAYDDICDWFEYSPVAMTQALGQRHLSELDAKPLFSTPQMYLKQRALVTGLRCGSVDEAHAQCVSMDILDDTLRHRFDAGKKPQLSFSKRLRYLDIALEVEKYILANLQQHFLLEELASKLAVSPFHLCRIFKLINNVSIHEYQLQLRLRLSLGDLPRCRDIAQLALDNGFSSHSHYSTRFKRVFGCTPKQFRQQIAVSTAPSNNQ